MWRCSWCGIENETARCGRCGKEDAVKISPDAGERSERPGIEEQKGEPKTPDDVDGGRPLSRQRKSMGVMPIALRRLQC